jgi:membrane associated rhomboid family serine protease
MTQFSPGGFDVLPPVVKNLIIVNALVWLAQITLGRYFPIEDLFALHDVHSTLFRPHQLITHLFMHDPSGPFHIFFNMFALWMFGKTLENVWGSKRFLIFYVLCGLGAACMHLGVLYYENGKLLEQFAMLDPANRDMLNEQVIQKINEATLGASGAVFGCLAAFGYLFPNTYVYLYFFVPIKVKWFVIGYAAVELWSGIRNAAGDNVAHFAHLGGALVGLILVIYWNKSNRNTFY